MWDAVGVGEREEHAYEALVRRGHETLAGLTADLDLSRAQVARTLSRLVEQGMVTRLPGRPVRFAAIAPEQVAASLIADRERDLLELRTHAQTLAEVHRRAGASGGHPADLVEVVEGGTNVRNAFRRLQQDARRQFRGFDRPPYLHDPLKGNADEGRRLSTREIAYRVIYDRSAVAMPGRMTDIWKGIHLGEQARVGDVPMKMMLCDQRAALIPVTTAGAEHTPDAAYLLRPSSLLDALSALFEALWERAVPLNRMPSAGSDPGLGGPGGEVTPVVADLLGMLAAGHTDEAIARSLGWHVRTVSRHVHRLMTALGTQTRFQLGMEAARRGWV